VKKREVDAVLRRLSRLTAKVAKKRDEARELVSDYDALVDSVRDAGDDFEEAVAGLERARRSFEDAVETMSQYA
jgi:ABC-type transporter Mla subunit MlaD